MTFLDYQTAIEALPYGKRLPTAVYVYIDDCVQIPEPLASLVRGLRERFAPDGKHNLVKFHIQSFKISLLYYPGFFDEPHPTLTEALVIDLLEGKTKRLSYKEQQNPPILHRKETMLPAEHLRFQEFSTLSVEEEKHGLYRETSRIGFKLNWEKLLREHCLSYRGHEIITDTDERAIHKQENGTPAVHRHRTAMNRSELSKPVREALNLGLLLPTQTFFDYGCGHGSDVRFLREMGFQASGWDPVHASTEIRRKARVVNLGFVLNVIEDPAERIETLAAAWSLAEDILIVSTLVEGQEAYSGFTRNLNDGIVTTRSTFQKYFGQVELQMLIEETLHVDADAIGLGIFVVFRSLQDRQAFLFSRIQRDLHATSVHRRFVRPSPVRKPRPGFTEIYAAHQGILDAFWLRFATLGRLPLASEFERMEDLVREIGSPSKVARLLTEHFGSEVIEDARKERTDDLLVYLALAQFRRAIPLRDLPESLQSDIKAFFGNYQEAQQRAKALLYSAGQTETVSQACESMTFGWKTTDHFTIHRSLLDLIPPVLRVYVHCSSMIYGNPRDADLIKIHKHSGKVTLQFYKDFDEQMLPELRLRVKVNLRSLRVQIFDHSEPPFRQLMPFKERFLGPEAPGRAEIEKFSRKLRRLGLTPEATDNGVSPEVMAAALRRFTRG